jgi:hypothetical protein
MKDREVLSRSKYKLFLTVLKYLPYLLMLIDIVNTYAGKPIVSFIGGVSYLGIMFMWLTSTFFRFCAYHRIPLYYLLMNNTLTLFRDYFGMCTDRLDKHLATAGMTAMILTFIYIIEKGDERTFIDAQDSPGQDD